MNLLHTYIIGVLVSAFFLGAFDMLKNGVEDLHPQNSVTMALTWPVLASYVVGASVAYKKTGG